MMGDKLHALFRYLWEHAISFAIIVFLLAIVFFLVAFWPLRENEVGRPICVTIAATLISIAAIRVFYETFASQSLASAFTILEESTQSGLRRIFLPQSPPNWLQCMERSSRITMFGIKLGLFENKTIVDSMTNRLNTGNVKITLILCDPRSTPMQIRYWKDEPRGIPTAWGEGLRDLATQIKSLQEWHNILRSPENLSLKLFRGYPSMAIFCFNEELYYYSYPYGERGIHGPVFALRGTGLSAVKFLKSILQRIENDSIELNDEEVEDIQDKKEKGEFDDKTLESKLKAI